MLHFIAQKILSIVASRISIKKMYARSIEKKKKRDLAKVRHQYLNVKNSIELEAFHLYISTYLQWLQCHPSPNIPDQSIFHLRRHRTYHLSHLRLS